MSIVSGINRYLQKLEACVQAVASGTAERGQTQNATRDCPVVIRQCPIIAPIFNRIAWRTEDFRRLQLILQIRNSRCTRNCVGY